MSLMNIFRRNQPDPVADSLRAVTTQVERSKKAETLRLERSMQRNRRAQRTLEDRISEISDVLSGTEK